MERAVTTVSVLRVAKRIDALPEVPAPLFCKSFLQSSLKRVSKKLRGQRYSGASSRHGGLTRTKDGQIAAMRGAGQPRGAAAGAAFNRSRRSAYEPSPDPQRPPEPRNEGSPTPRFGPASRSRDGEGEAHTDSNHSTTMARSLGASMARGLGILLIMMTLSEIAATRARPVYNTKGCSLPPSRRHRARRPPFKTRAGRRRWAAATTGTSGGSAAAAILEMRRRISRQRRLRVQRGRLDLLHRGRRHLRLLRGLRHRC